MSKIIKKELVRKNYSLKEEFDYWSIYDDNSKGGNSYYRREENGKIYWSGGTSGNWSGSTMGGCILSMEETNELETAYQGLKHKQP